MKVGIFFNRLIYYFLSILIICLVLLVFVNVVFRWFGISVFWSEEITKLLFIWITFIGAIVVFQKNKHIVSEIFFEHFQKKVKWIVEIIDIFLIAMILVVLIIASIKLVLLQMKTITPALMIPYSVFSLPALISFFAMFITLVKRFHSRLIKIKQGRLKIGEDLLGER